MGGTISGAPSRVQLAKRATASRHRCRCGTRLVVGAPCFEFDSVPEALTALLRDQVFCTLGCVRAFLLEAMEVMEGEASTTVISDVQSVYSYLRLMFALAQDAPLVSVTPVVLPG